MKNYPIKNYTREEVEEIMKKDDITMHQFLENIQKQGYFLHGSTEGNIKKFEPRIPEDNRGGWYAQKGVYATSTTQPIFFAVAHRDKIEGSGQIIISRDEKENTVYGVTKNFIDNKAIQPGWVYIFANEGFSEDPDGSGEWVNLNPVKPVGNVPVSPSDLEHPIRIIKEWSENESWEEYKPDYQY